MWIHHYDKLSILCGCKHGRIYAASDPDRKYQSSATFGRGEADLRRANTLGVLPTPRQRTYYRYRETLQWLCFPHHAVLDLVDQMGDGTLELRLGELMPTR